MLSSRANTRPWTAGIDRLPIVKIFVVQVIILFALSLAAIRYLAWTSELAQAEFSRAIEHAALAASPPHKSAGRQCQPAEARGLRA